MTTFVIARKELRRHRVSTVATFCVVTLVLLAAAAFVPRTWTAHATIALDPDPTRLATLGSSLRARIEAAAPGKGVNLVPEGSSIEVSYPAAGAQQALEGLNALLSRVVQEEIGVLRQRLEAEERALAAQVAEAAEQVDALAQQLAAGRSGMPAGGESALGARIGQYQGELDALRLDLRASAELQARATAWIRELDGKIVAEEQVTGEAQAEATARIQSELKPQRNAAAARLESLRDEHYAKERRLREISALLEGASEQTTVLQQETETLRELQRRYDDAAALHRQLRLRLQEARDGIALKLTASALPFRVVAPPLLPASPDGLPAWIWLLAALAGGVTVAAARLLGAVLVDDRIRLAEEIVADAELPVLAVIGEHLPVQAVGRVRWSVMGVALLGALTVVAALAFMVAFG